MMSEARRGCVLADCDASLLQLTVPLRMVLESLCIVHLEFASVRGSFWKPARFAMCMDVVMWLM